MIIKKFTRVDAITTEDNKLEFHVYLPLNTCKLVADSYGVECFRDPNEKKYYILAKPADTKSKLKVHDTGESYQIELDIFNDHAFFIVLTSTILSDWEQQWCKEWEEITEKLRNSGANLRIPIVSEEQSRKVVKGEHMYNLFRDNRKICK